MKQSNIKYDMHGYLIEFNPSELSWSWSKWDYSVDFEGKMQVVRSSGLLEFKKMFPSVFEGKRENLSVNNQEEMERALNRMGVEFIFLYQGERQFESQFRTVEEAEKFYGLEECQPWNLTDYWYCYDSSIRSWAMFNTFTGDIEFTPQSAAAAMLKPRTQFFNIGAKARHANPTYH